MMGVPQTNDHTSPVSLDPTFEPTIRVHIKTYVVVAAICFIYFAGLVGIVGSGLLAQSIGQLFHANSQITWLSEVIVIITTILNLPLSQAADYWGRRWILVITTLLGSVGCIIVSRANDMGTAIAGFVLLGISFGSQSSLLAVVSEVVPRKQRPHAQVAANIAGGLGAIVGLIMGGTLLRHGDLENFRIYFYVDAGIFAAAGAGCAFFYTPPPRDLQASLTQGEKLRQLDWIGYALFSPGLTLFCVALSWSKNPYTWKDAHILATFIVGIILFLSFIVYEWRFKRDGILHHELFNSRNFPIALATIFVEGLSFFTANSYFAYEVGVFGKTDFLISSMHFSIIFFSTLVFALFAGFYSSKRKSVRTPLLLGFTALLMFNVLMASSNPRTPKNAFWGFPLFAGLGLGTILPISMVVAQLSTPKELITIASGLMISVRSFGASIGLAINNSIFDGALSTNIPSKVAAATLPLGLPPSSLAPFIGALTSGDSQALQNIPGVNGHVIEAGMAALVEAYSIGFRNVWTAASCFAFVAVVAAFFFKDPRSEFNSHIDAPAEKGLLDIQAASERNHGQIVVDNEKIIEE